MANADAIQRLASSRSKFEGILEAGNYLRPRLGEASMDSILRPKLDDLRRKIATVARHAADLPQGLVNQVDSVAGQLFATITDVENCSDGQYINQREQYLSQVDRMFDEIRLVWPVVLAIEIENSGILSAIPTVVDKAKDEVTETVERFRGFAQKLLEETRIEAQKIEDRAHLTASKISVKDAQEQFRDAQSDLESKVSSWKAASASFFFLFIATAGWFSFREVGEPLGTVVYTIAIRIAILTALAAATTFSLRVLRAHMHMREYNLHRQRVANSIQALVEAADPEQRGAILGKLVDAIVSFGNSGLLESSSDNIYAPQMTIETLLKSLPTGKSS